MSFKPPTEKRMIWTYRCEKCGTEDDYNVRLPDHLLVHLEPHLSPCNGKLTLVRSESVPHPPPG